MILNRKSVVNATRKLSIHITPKDISRGNTKNPASCAAALACLRNPKIKAARVHISTTYLQMDGKWVRYRTPESLRGEIVAFDRGAKFQPGDYILRPLQPSHRARGTGFGGTKTKNNKTKSKRAKPHHIGNIRHYAAVR